MLLPPPKAFLAVLVCGAFGTLGYAQSVMVQDNGEPAVILPSSTNSASNQITGSLTTLFASNNGFAGNMFDITPSLDMYITAVDINCTNAGTTATIDVWYKVGTSLGFETNAAAWTYLGSSVGISNGQDIPTFMDLANNGVLFQSGVTYGIYIDLTSYSAQTFKYTNGPTGGNTYSNADLSLLTNAGKGSGFSGGTFQVRDWNGTIYYQSALPSVSAPLLQAGNYGTFLLEQITPGSLVHFAISITGFGSASSIFGPLGIADPVFMLPPNPLVANAAGNCSLTITLPLSSFGRSLYIQGIEIQGVDVRMSEAIAATIQ